MNYEEYLDELLEAYEDAFQNLPVYKGGKSLPKMNDVDRLARDIAFECVLGGDRFDAKDVAEHLDGISISEMNLLKDRIKYHAVDFAPAEHRQDAFLNRMIDGMTSLVKVSDSTLIRQAFLDMSVRKERGAWFRFEDGDYRQCMSAVIDADRLGEGKRDMPRVRVTPDEVAKAKASLLLESYGEEVRMDGPVLTVNIKSYGEMEPGTSLYVRRVRDDLESDPLKLTYFVTYAHENGGKSTSLFSSLEPAELDRLIRALDTEIEYRKGRNLMEESDLAVLSFPADIRVQAPVANERDGGRNFYAERIFYGVDNEIMVAGKYMFQTEVVNFPLREFSDKSLSVINAESEKVLKALTMKADSMKAKPSKAVRSID